ncbi:MAG: 2-oxo acid dehydrogenase subunit E2 [Nitrospirae bacterium]|nr:2-oxo acid dehydrogenase subunit E2 [Nitrospirota bacterium]
MAEFRMPTLGADMSAGTLVAWLKKPGDSVKRGDIIAEVETDKAAIEVEIFTSGVIEKLLVQPGEKVPVGTVLAIIREEGKAVEPGRLRISPSAKQLAAELGVDPASVRGTGPDGAISRADIEAVARRARDKGLETIGEEPVRPLAPSPAPLAPAAETAAKRQARMRQAIAAAMARSKREIPHYYLSTTIDMGRAMAWLSEKNRKRPIQSRLLYGVLLIKAVAVALREVPELNAVWKGNQAVQSQAIHVGVAISLRQGGLVAPALHDTDRQSLDQLMTNFLDLVKRARAGSLRSSELSDPTITVTSLGEQGVETVFGVIYPPQVALVGFGKMMDRPWVAEGKIVPRPIMTATLSADHRVSDGHRGGLFLAAVDRLLQDPSQL